MLLPLLDSAETSPFLSKKPMGKKARRRDLTKRQREHDVQVLPGVVYRADGSIADAEVDVMSEVCSTGPNEQVKMLQSRNQALRRLAASLLPA